MRGDGALWWFPTINHILLSNWALGYPNILMLTFMLPCGQCHVPFGCEDACVFRDFPGCPVARLCTSTAGGAWVWSLVGELRSCKPQGAAKKKKKRCRCSCLPGNHIFLAWGTSFQNHHFSLGSVREPPVWGDSSWKKRLSCAVPSDLPPTGSVTLGNTPRAFAS